MSKRKPNSNLVSIRNHLSVSVRLRKGMTGIALLVLALYLLFGPRFDQFKGYETAITIGLLLATFIAFGLGWVNASQALMGWSRQIDFDFDKNEVCQISASILGRSRPYIVPFAKIAAFDVKEGPVAGEGGDAAEAMIEMRDRDGSLLVKAGMFENAEQAETMAGRIGDAVIMAYQQQQGESR